MKKRETLEDVIRMSCRIQERLLKEDGIGVALSMTWHPMKPPELTMTRDGFRPKKKP